MMAQILVVDDKQSMRRMVGELFTSLNFTVLEADCGTGALELLRTRGADLVISDIRMPDFDGLELLRKARAEGIDAQFILMTAFGTVETAVEAMKLGAFDYILKPFSLDEMELLTRRAIETRQLLREVEYLRDEVRGRDENLAGMTGSDPSMTKVFELIRQVAPSDTSVLVTGASGTGKELVATALHNLSTRTDKPFVKINCGALTPTLIESELFGHVRGAFTGAVKDKTGRFALADGGTLFLDEIGEIEPATQVKLLRVLQEGEFEPVGSDRTQKVDVRIIAATNRNLKDEIKQGNFREDLFWRLNVIAVELPPLRERGEDVQRIADTLLQRLSLRHKRKIEGFAPDVLNAFRRYDWPGNVRELENVVERAVVLCRGDEITLELIPADLTGRSTKPSSWQRTDLALPEKLDAIERELILEALTTHHGVQTKTAEALGITRTTLQYKLQKFDLNVPPEGK